MEFGGKVGEGVVSAYPDLIAECPRISGYIYFFNEKIGGIFIDRKAIENVASSWSQWSE